MMRKKIVCILMLAAMLCCAAGFALFAAADEVPAALASARANTNPNEVAAHIVSKDLMPLGGAAQATYDSATDSFTVDMQKASWTRSVKVFEGIGDKVIKNGATVSAAQATVYYKATVNFSTANSQTLLGIVVGKRAVDEPNTKTRYFTLSIKPQASHVFGYNFVNANAPASKTDEISEQLSTEAKTYSANTDYVLEVIKAPDSISVYVNGEAVATNIATVSVKNSGATSSESVENMLPAFGVNVCQGDPSTVGTISGFTMKYLDATAVSVPTDSGITKGTNIYEEGDGFNKGLAENSTLTDGGNKYIYGGTVQDYYALDSRALTAATSYKVGGVEKQIGELSVYFSADITLAALGTDSWHGLGLLVGAKDGKNHVVRMQQDGGCHVIDLTSNVVSPSNYSTGITLSANCTYRFEMLRAGSKLSVWINGKKIFDAVDIGSGFDNKIGVMFACVGKDAYVENINCYFTEDVEVTMPAKTPIATKGTDIYKSGDGFLAGISGNTLTSQNGKFVFSGGQQNYYSLASEALSALGYKVDGEEKEIEELSIYFSADITISDIGTDGWHGMGLLVGVKDGNTYVLRMQKDGGCHIINTTANQVIQSNYSPEVKLTQNGKYKFEMVRGAGKVSGWINGKNVFSDVEIGDGFDGRLGVMFANVGQGSNVGNIQCYFTEEVEIVTELPPERPEIPKGTDIYADGDGFGTGIRAAGTLIEDDGKFEYVKTAQDYFPLASAALTSATYKVDGEEKSVGELSVYFSADITLAELGSENWNGIGLLVGVKNGTAYVVRMQQDGGCHILNPDSAVLSNHSTGITLAADGKYTLEMLRSDGKLSVWINGRTIFDDVTIESGLDEKIGVMFACVGVGAYVDNVQCYFTEDVAVEITQVGPVEPERPTMEKGTDIYVAGDGFSTGIRQGVNLTADDDKFVFGGTYQDYFPLDSAALTSSTYKVDGEEKTIGELSVYFSADITLAALGTDNWHGIGLLIGTKGNDMYVLRMEQSGNCNIINRDSLYLGNASPGLVLKANGKYSFEMFRSGNKLWVWINEKNIFNGSEIESGLDGNIGVMFACVGAGAYVDNVQCYFTEDVTIEAKPEEPEGPDVDKGTDIFVSGDKFGSGILEYGTLAENNGKFTFKGVGQDYYPIVSDALHDSIYKVNGEEKSIGELSVYFSATITIPSTGTENWHGTGLLIGTKGGTNYVVRMQKDGGCHILDPTSNPLLIVASNHNPGVTLEADGTYTFEMVRSIDKVSVWINGKKIFEDVELATGLDGRMGVMFAGLGSGDGATVENVQCYFTENVTVEAVQKPSVEDPSTSDKEPDHNTEQIITPVPVPTAPEKKSNGGVVAMIVIGCVLAAGCIAGIVTLCIIRKKKKNPTVGE